MISHGTCAESKRSIRNDTGVDSRLRLSLCVFSGEHSGMTWGGGFTIEGFNKKGCDVPLFLSIYLYYQPVVLPLF